MDYKDLFDIDSDYVKSNFEQSFSPLRTVDAVILKCTYKHLKVFY
jgi:hypothetical protein